MKEIKIRAWDKKHGRMLFPGDRRTDVLSIYYRPNTGDVLSIEIGKELGDGFLDGAKTFAESPDENDPVFMLWSGLRDRKGTPVYEGDRLQQYYLKDGAPVKDGKYFVEFRIGGFYAFNDKGLGFALSEVIHSCEITGHIYELKTDEPNGESNAG